MDTNVDCLACSETDSKGNLIDHMVVPFNIEGISSGHAEHVLSKALDEVFRWCVEKKKPLVMEDLKDVATTDHYGDKALNRKLSGFAHRKITELAESKTFKYATDLRKVNPAFTSQMGKVKYMGRYGLSVHESAALVITRRGMGFKERLPKRYRLSIPKEKIHMHHWSHWRHFHKNFKGTTPEMSYFRPGRMKVSGVFT